MTNRAKIVEPAPVRGNLSANQSRTGGGPVFRKPPALRQCFPETRFTVRGKSG